MLNVNHVFPLFNFYPATILSVHCAANVLRKLQLRAATFRYLVANDFCSTLGRDVSSASAEMLCAGGDHPPRRSVALPLAAQN
jgi:hypothetical protein